MRGHCTLLRGDGPAYGPPTSDWLENRRKGERNWAGKPDGTPKPDKHLNWDPTREEWFVKDPHTGKRKYKDKGYRPPPSANFPLDDDDDDDANPCP